MKNVDSYPLAWYSIAVTACAGLLNLCPFSDERSGEKVSRCLGRSSETG